MIQMEKLKVRAHDFIKSGEKYLKTDTVYLAKGSFWNILSQAASTVVSVGLAVVMGHLVPKELYGNYKYLISLASLMGVFSLTGLSTAVIQAVAKGYDGELREAFKLNLRWSFAIISMSLIGALYYYFNKNFTLAGALVLIGALTPLLNGALLYISFLSGKKEFKFLAISGFWRNAVPAMLITITILFTQNPLILVATYLISNTAIAMFFYFYSLKKYEKNKNVDPETGRYGIHLSVMGILIGIAEQIDKVVVFQHLGGAPLAVYSFATAIPIQLKGLFKNVYQLTLPKFSERPIQEIRAGMRQKMIISGVALILIVALYIAVAPFIFKLLFPKYIESVIYSQVFALFLLPYIMIFPQAALHAHRAVARLYETNIYLSVVKIILILVPIFFYGIWGVIGGKIAYEFFSFIVVYRSFIKYAKMET